MHGHRNPKPIECTVTVIPVALNVNGASSVGNISGAGSTSYVARWTGTSSLGTGALVDVGTAVGIGTLLPSYPLYVTSSTAADAIYGSSGATSGNGVYGYASGSGATDASGLAHRQGTRQGLHAGATGAQRASGSERHRRR
jgi:hypothetical protein